MYYLTFCTVAFNFLIIFLVQHEILRGHFLACSWVHICSNVQWAHFNLTQLFFLIMCKGFTLSTTLLRHIEGLCNKTCRFEARCRTYQRQRCQKWDYVSQIMQCISRNVPNDSYDQLHSICE